MVPFLPSKNQEDWDHPDAAERDDVGQLEQMAEAHAADRPVGRRPAGRRSDAGARPICEVACSRRRIAALRSRPATGAPTRARSETVPSRYSSSAPRRRAAPSRPDRRVGGQRHRHLLAPGTEPSRNRQQLIQPPLRSAESRPVGWGEPHPVGSVRRSVLFITMIATPRPRRSPPAPGRRSPSARRRAANWHRRRAAADRRCGLPRAWP